MGKVKRHKGPFIEGQTGDSGPGSRQHGNNKTSTAGSSQGDRKPSIRGARLYELRTLHRGDMRDSGS